jgi:imidazole glycerol-phosphate synthase subunit HisH
LITIIDYGLGNVHAIANIYKRLNVPVAMAQSAAHVRMARKIVLPGVGAFDWAMSRLNSSGMRETLDERVRGGYCDVIGICVGMQILADRSEEGVLSGLGWIPGNIKLFDRAQLDKDIQLPHMGWNDVVSREGEGLFRGMDGEARFYFLHSYYFDPQSQADVMSTADYGGKFTCGVRRGKVIGVQFHPEKSHSWGIALLKNFAEI